MPDRRFWQRSRIAAAAVMALLLGWLYAVVSVWNDRSTTLIVGVVALFALVLLIDWAFDLFGPPAWRLLRSVGVSIGRAVAHDREVKAWLSRHPSFGGWLRARLTLRRWTGWYLTATVLVTLWFLARFVSILRDVVSSSSLALYDPGISALVRAFRTPGSTRILWAATVFGDPRSMYAVAAVFVLLLLLWGRRGEAVLVAVTMAIGSTLGDIVKVATHRPRPPAFYALVRLPTSMSFPSGHALASLLFFALLALVLWRSVGTTGRRRFLIVVACGVGAFTVALSRIYLGVHWATDVVGGWFLALTWGSVTFGAFFMWERYAPGPKVWPAISSRRVRIGVTAGAVAVAGVVLVAGAQADPLLQKLVSPPPPVAYRSTQLGTFERALPRFTEKLNGSPEEPVSLVFVGSRQQLIGAFEGAGWQVADHQSVTALLHVTIAVISNKPYPTAPVTPAFVNDKPNDLAFEKSAGAATARRRHHARFWLTNVTLDGRAVWVGTASFDSRTEISGTVPIPTHHIDPDIDAERSYIVRALLATGRVRRAFAYQVTTPEKGSNSQGDPFRTDGRAVGLEAR